MKKRLIGAALAICALLLGCHKETVETATQDAGHTPAPECTAAIPSPEEDPAQEAFFQEVKTYLLSGQEDLPEAGRLHWAADFLEAVDWNSVYNAYMEAGEKAGDVDSFARYLTENAPIPASWKELFESDLWEQYGYAVDHYEALDEGVYQAYVSIDGQSVPFVAVNAHTGWYHG